MRKSVLKFENVTVKYDGTEVLKDFSCDIAESEFVSLIGPNGSGKSTIINSVLNTVAISNGEIFLNGKNNALYTSKERARFAAVVPQYFSTAFGFKVKEIVMMGRNPYLRRMQQESAEDIAIVEDALRMTNTYKFKDRKITSLSGGERQRVVIAGALAQRPKLLILDEPTNHLDLHHTLEIMQLIKDLNQNDGMTVFAVLHDINMAARFSDRLVLLNEGVKVTSGSVQDVIKPEVLQPVYKVNLVVKNNRLTDSPEIIPLRKLKDEVPVNCRRIHVVCGGGSGEAILEELNARGYEISCGVLNIGDSDIEACEALNVEVVADLPYSPVSEEKQIVNVKLMSECDAVILTEVPIGSGNLSNVEAVQKTADLTGADVYIISSGNRDFTGGRADKIINEMLDKKQAIMIDRSKLMDKIKKMQV